MRDKLLAKIQAACIKANPEILQNVILTRDGIDYEEQEPREIDLADVILALQGKLKGDLYLSPVGGFLDIGAFGKDGFYAHERWDLLAGPLERQTDPLVGFIASLL